MDTAGSVLPEVKGRNTGTYKGVQFSVADEAFRNPSDLEGFQGFRP